MTPKTQQEALQAGSKYFHTGKPCKRGHVADRLASNRTCVACASENSKRHYEVKKDEISAARKCRYYADVEQARKQRRESAQARRERKPEETRLYAAEYYQRNKERLLAAQAEKRKAACKHREPRKPALTARQRSYAYYLRNKQQSHQRSVARARERRSADFLFAFKHSLRARVSHAFSAKGYTKRSKTAELIGCDYEFLKQHIERQFLPGMTWENRHQWHVDHITPLATAETVEQLEALCHFTNLRPIWKEDNMKKSDSITHLI